MVSYKNIGSKTIIHEIPVKETKAVFSKFEKKQTNKKQKRTEHFQAKLLWHNLIPYKIKYSKIYRMT